MEKKKKQTNPNPQIGVTFYGKNSSFAGHVMGLGKGGYTAIGYIAMNE